MIETLGALSAFFGWVYFSAWSVPFYLQIYKNWKLKNVEEDKLDFVLLNIIGFIFYAFMYVLGFFWQNTNPHANYGLGKIEIQDFLYAVHALLLSGIIGVQCLIYQRGSNKISVLAWCLAAFCLISTVFFYLAFHVFHWIKSSRDFNFLLYIGGLKISVSVLQYVPTAYWNYIRKSTVDWNLLNVFLDLAGGFFSIAQTIVDVWDAESNLINPIKFTLGNVSMAFGILFIVQHCFLYKGVHPESSDLARKELKKKGHLKEGEKLLAENL